MLQHQFLNEKVSGLNECKLANLFCFLCQDWYSKTPITHLMSNMENETLYFSSIWDSYVNSLGFVLLKLFFVYNSFV